MDFFASLAEKNRTRLVLLLFLAFACIASSPLSLENWFKGGDSIIHLIRSNDVCYEMSLGNYYPRFLSQASFGKGLPTLNFYSPAFYLAVGYLNAAGLHIITAMALVCAACFFLSGWGMFIWTKKHCGEVGALIAATIYLFAPYHLVDIYLRGAFPEFIALAILPYLFHGIDLSFSPATKVEGMAYTALASAAIVLVHNLSAVIIFPFALCYYVWCCIRSHQSFRDCLAASVGPLVGAGLSSFYWLPVILEKKHLLGSGVSIDGSLHYSRHFNSLAGFLASSEFSVFAFSPVYAVMFVCAAASTIALVRCKGDKRGFGLAAAVLCFLSVAMTLQITTPIYEAIPALQYLQFPYRFLGPATLFLSAFCGFVPWIKLLAGNRKASFGVAGLVIVACVIFSGGLRKVEAQLPSFPPNPVAFSNNSYPIFHSWSDSDFMPADSSLGRGDIVKYPVLSSRDVEVPLTGYRKIGSNLTCRVALRETSDLKGPWLYFPGWKATCDGKEVPVFPDKDGLIAVTIPAGVHDIQISFGTTWPRVAGWILTAMTLVISACCLLLRYFRQRTGITDEQARLDHPAADPAVTPEVTDAAA